VNFPDLPLSHQVFIVVVAVLGTARLTRLFAVDDYPPIVWARGRWIARLQKSGWAELAFCPFCQSVYIAAFTLATGLISDFHPAWVVFYSWLSLAYSAAILVVRDTPRGG